MSSERSVKDLSGLYTKRLVGVNGFEPSTSWSRTRHLNPINALSGVAYGTRSAIPPLLVVPKLYLSIPSSTTTSARTSVKFSLTQTVEPQTRHQARERELRVQASDFTFGHFAHSGAISCRPVYP